MKSSYKRLGGFIHKIDVRNNNSRNTKLLGLSMTKEFRPHASNIIGTDLSRYKVVDHWQFACDFMSTIRVRKLPVVLQDKDEQIIVSPAYTTFEVIDPKELHPEYLMMWFRRSEFDRYAYFCCDSAVRGGFNWDELCDVELPVPSIEKQQEIVKEYNIIVNLIRLSEQLNQKLEETAQALYKHWFVDFEFPNEKGQPYKSSGGRMVYNERLDQDVPEGWKALPFTKQVELKGGGTPSTIVNDYWGGDISFFTAKDVLKGYYSLETEKKITEEGLNNCSSKLYAKDTTFIVARGATVGSVSIAAKNMAMNQSCYAIIARDSCSLFAHQLTLDLMKKLTREAMGATFSALVTKDFDDQYVISPSIGIIKQYEDNAEQLYHFLHLNLRKMGTLSKCRSLLLSRLSEHKSPQTSSAI